MIKVLRVFIVNICFFLSFSWEAFAGILIEKIPMDDAPPIIVLKGAFDLNDDPGVLEHEVNLTGAKLVTFTSQGGNIISAMAYGRMIRSLGLSTLQTRSSECASACALAFVGGITRYAEPGAIGVHQSSFAPDDTTDGQRAVTAVQMITAHIMAYLGEMGVDPRLLQLSLSVPNDDMRYLTAREMKDYKVTFNSETVSTHTLPATHLTKPAMAEQFAEAGNGSAILPEEKANAFLISYYDTWSDSDTLAFRFIDTAYAETITFYGTDRSRNYVIAEKRKFIERWPFRAYNPRSETVKITCEENCRIAGVVEWYARSTTGKISSGEAEFAFLWNPFDNVIKSEAGKVLVLDKGSLTPARIISQWETEGQQCSSGAGEAGAVLKACARKEKLGEKLQAVGWCYRLNNEHSYQKAWRNCSPASTESSDVQNSRGQTVSYRPQAYQPSGQYLGKTKMPDFKGRDRDFNSFRTRIRNGLKSGPNFSNHFSLIQFGCGTGCSTVIVSDNNTGKPIGFPRGGEEHMYLSLKFRSNSRLIAAQWADYNQQSCYMELFDFRKNSWKLLSTVRVGDLEACYKDIDQNLLH